MGLFIAFWSKIFFWKEDYNYYEIIIMLCFVMGIGMLIFAVFAILQGLMHYDLTRPAGAIGIGYCVWAIGQFFNKQKVMSYVKALASYLLGLASFVGTVFLLGVLIDVIINR